MSNLIFILKDESKNKTLSLKIAYSLVVKGTQNIIVQNSREKL